MLIEPVVSGSSFVQMALAGGAGMTVFILVVVPLDQFRQLKTRVFGARRDRGQLILRCVNTWVSVGLPIGYGDGRIERVLKSAATPPSCWWWATAAEGSPACC